MLKNIVLITIENFNREYNGKNLLSRELVKKGFIVFGNLIFHHQQILQN